MNKKTKRIQKITQEEYYRRLLRNQTADDRNRIEKAYEQAWHARDFEIDNYWKRTLYFWGFQVASFAGYFKLVLKNEAHEPLLFCVSCIGFITALAWVLANKGSKAWQENWEKHIDMLEDYITGPLYKIVSNQSYSVSRVNLGVSRFFSVFWFVLAIYYGRIYLKLITTQSDGIAWLEILCGCLTAFTALNLIILGKSHNKTINKKIFFIRPNIFYSKGENEK
jgi:hypothetical protein